MAMIYGNIVAFFIFVIQLEHQIALLHRLCCACAIAWVE